MVVHGQVKVSGQFGGKSWIEVEMVAIDAVRVTAVLLVMVEVTVA